MTLYFSVNVKTLFELGKGYPWIRPDRCPRCKGIRLWGHGYAERYFEGFNKALLVKRYRCPDCESVHTMRPEQFWKGFRYPIVVILFSLLNKLNRRYNKWLSCISRQNQQYWFKGLRFQSSRQENVKSPTIDTLKRLLLNSFIPVTHSEQFEILLL